LASTEVVLSSQQGSKLGPQHENKGDILGNREAGRVELTYGVLDDLHGRGGLSLILKSLEAALAGL
jgi:hypothetical protein